MNNNTNAKPQSLLQKAREQTGLDDFGEPPFEDNYQLFMHSVLDQGDVPPAKMPAFENYILRILKNRLWFTEDLKKHPAIEQERLLPPVVVTSMPRTGSSKLQRMLCATDGFQSALYWHMHQYARMPNTADGGVAQRIQLTREFEAWTDSVVPDFHQGHPMHAEEAEEEPILMESTFLSGWLACNFNAPEYTQHLAQSDLTPSYDYMRRLLQYIQWQFYGDNVRPYLFKSPGNLGTEHYISAAFPADITFIMTHRAPELTIPSGARVIDLLRQKFNNPPDKRTIGQFALQMFANGLKQHMAWRSNNPSAQILDISFEDVCEKPIAVAQRVYDYLGLTLSGEAIDRINSWNTANPRDKHGKNIYSLQMYGLDEAQIDEHFADYKAAFAQFI